VALEQHRSGVKDECEDRAVGLDEIKCLLQGAPGGDRVAERVAGDRLQQEGLTRPAQVGHRGGAVQDGGASAAVAACGSPWASHSAARALRSSPRSVSSSPATAEGHRRRLGSQQPQP